MKSLKNVINEGRQIDAIDMGTYLTQYVTNEWPTLKQGEDFDSITVEYLKYAPLTIYIQLPCGKGYSSHNREVRAMFKMEEFKYVTKDKIRSKNDQTVIDKVVNSIGDYFATRGISYVDKFEIVLTQELD